jgi:hypothetical protein
MLDLVPARTFFRFEVPIHYWDRRPHLDGDLTKWPGRFLVPPLGELEGARPYAAVYWAWNESGLYFAYHIARRWGPLRCDPNQWWKGDGARLCIDTRDTRDVKRGTRFCHFFYFLPQGGGRDGSRPIVGFHRMSRAKESPPVPDVSLIRVCAVHRPGCCSFEAAIPASCLNGWDPAEHPRIGVFYKIKDSARGAQTLTVADDLGWNVDPSTWATGVLVR